MVHQVGANLELDFSGFTNVNTRPQSAVDCSASKRPAALPDNQAQHPRRRE